MAYQIVSVSDVVQTLPNITGLGISLYDTNPIFRTIYDINQQATENLKTLLLTRKGERYMEPEFGTELLSIVFLPNISELKQNISEILNSAISYWLPYITIETLDILTAEENPDLPHHIKITLEYSVENFNTNSITITADSNGVVTII